MNDKNNPPALKPLKAKKGSGPKRAPISPLAVAAAAFAMRNVRKVGTETNAHRNKRAATPIIGPGFSRKRLRQHMPDKYSPCPCGSGKRFNLCCWTTEYARL